MNVRLKKVLMETGKEGMFMDAAFRLIDKEIERGNIPGGAAVIGAGGKVYEYSAGYAVCTEHDNIAAVMDTIYDCASLTKVVVTLPLLLICLEKGLARLDDPVAYFLPKFAERGKDGITLKQLATHTSGLAPYYNMHSEGWTRETILDFILGLETEYVPGSSMAYSDLGFILLGEIVARLLDMPLHEAAERYVFEPLGMNDTMYRPQAGLKPRIAATEYVERLSAYRWGSVHDENAGAMGGVSGHAGLFSTARDIARYCEIWLKRERRDVLSPASKAAAVANCTKHIPGASRGLGWVLKNDVWDASGDLYSAHSFGHTGFTGTSLWIDPNRDLYAVLMTNRVHFGRDKSIARLRACFHNAAAAECVRKC
ncbi:serine hydrolase domain-containing protein [Paenibacillus thermotolerans]|uniref:serine hydrolase domain-containing protein n=1 Tax=Paenibacillus thermotolerans TaxID=3027807 RepID=UPI002368D2E4|nr:MULTISPECIES: serine hydrolase domain-containing protein [unclassified Paenibacillus]